MLAGMDRADFESENDVSAWDNQGNDAFQLSQEPNGKRIKVIGVPNRRRETRHKVSWEFSGKFFDERKQETKFVGFVEDISTQGILISSKANLKSGQRFFIKIKTFVYGKAKHLNVIVSIKHVSLSQANYRIGGVFVHISEEDRRFLEKFTRGNNPH